MTAGQKSGVETCGGGPQHQPGSRDKQWTILSQVSQPSWVMSKQYGAAPGSSSVPAKLYHYVISNLILKKKL